MQINRRNPYDWSILLVHALRCVRVATSRDEDEAISVISATSCPARPGKTRQRMKLYTIDDKDDVVDECDEESPADDGWRRAHLAKFLLSRKSMHKQSSGVQKRSPS